MQSCPGCLALLRPEEVDLGPDLVRALSSGLRMHRPAGRAPFESGPACSLLRLRPDGAPLGSYLRAGGPLSQRIDVRDETSAPVAHFEPGSRGGFQLVETGGAVVGTGERIDVEDEGWVDDQWSVTPATADLPIAPLAVVALVVAPKVLLGRPEPVRVREPEERERDDLDDVLGPIGRTIVEGFLDG